MGRRNGPCWAPLVSFLLLQLPSLLFLPLLLPHLLQVLLLEPVPLLLHAVLLAPLPIAARGCVTGSGLHHWLGICFAAAAAAAALSRVAASLVAVDVCCKETQRT